MDITGREQIELLIIFVVMISSLAVLVLIQKISDRGGDENSETK